MALQIPPIVDPPSTTSFDRSSTQIELPPFVALANRSVNQIGQFADDTIKDIVPGSSATAQKTGETHYLLGFFVLVVFIAGAYFMFNKIKNL
jgi:hypothetical protein